MDTQMFCYQCEQTAGCSACTGGAGVCGKTAETAGLQDQLTGALIGLAQSAKPTAEVCEAIIEGLFTTVTNVSFDDESITELIERVKGLGSGEVLDMTQIWDADEDTRSLKSLILFGIRGMAAYAHHALALGYQDDEVNAFFCEALRTIGSEETADSLLPHVLKWER